MSAEKHAGVNSVGWNAGLCPMSLTKKERKDLIIKIQVLLRSGIIKNDKGQIIDAYRWLEDLLSDHGVYVLNSELPKFPDGA